MKILEVNNFTYGSMQSFKVSFLNKAVFTYSNEHLFISIFSKNFLLNNGELTRELKP